MKRLLKTLIEQLREVFLGIADPRAGHNKQYAFDDILMSAFSVFHM